MQRRERRFVLAGIRQQRAHSSGSTESGAGHVGGRRCATGFALRLHATGSGGHVSTAFHGDGNDIFSGALSDRLGTNGRSESAIGIRVCGRLTRQRARPLRNRSLRHRWRLGRWRRGRRMSRLPMIRFHLSLEIVYRTNQEPNQDRSNVARVAAFTIPESELSSPSAHRSSVCFPVPSWSFDWSAVPRLQREMPLPTVAFAVSVAETRRSWPRVRI